MDENELLESIEHTNRKITKMEMEVTFFGATESQQRRTISIIEKFSVTFKCLILRGTLEMSDFLEILSLVPNVEHLHFESLYLQTDQQTMPSNEDLNLRELKTLKFSQCNVDFVSVTSVTAQGHFTVTSTVSLSVIICNTKHFYENPLSAIFLGNPSCHK